MNASEIKLGTKLDFEIINSTGSKIGQSYKSELIGIESDTDIIISYPASESRLMFISAGTNIRISFLHEKEGLLIFTAIITGKERSSSHALLHARTGKDFKEIQRRNYFRPDCNLKSEYRWLEKTGITENNSNNEPYIKTKTINISSYGACIIVNKDIPMKSIIDLIVWFTDKISIRMMCSVVRNIENRYGKTLRYEIGLCLEDITQVDQEILLRYITNNVTVKERLLHWDEPDIL